MGSPGLRGRARRWEGLPSRSSSSSTSHPTAAGFGGERRELQVTESPRDRTRKIVQGLLAGPKGQTLYRPFPQGVRLGSVLLVGDVVYLDFVWDGHPDPPSSGSTEEIQRVYSVVDSICLNVPEVQQVVLLWNGFQRITFGHLDLSQPIRPDRSLAAP